MYFNIKSLFAFVLLFAFSTTTQAQLFKKLSRKLERKVERKIEKEIDKEIDEALEGKSSDQGESEKAVRSFGSFLVRHSNNYGSVNIEELATPVVEQNDEGYSINVAWRSHEVDVFDGFSLRIKTDQEIRHDKIDFKDRLTFRIPEDATLTLGYDPQMPYLKKDKDNFKRGVSDDYQNYDLLKGEVSIDILDVENIQISFSGEADLRKVIREASTEKGYTESFYRSNLTGAIDAKRPKFLNNTSNKRTAEEDGKSVTSWDDMAPKQESTSASVPGKYSFNFKTDVSITIPDEDRVYKMSYLMHPDREYVAMQVNLGDYDTEMSGESIIVIDGDDSHIFVETEGMKMRISQNMMQGQGMQNPTAQMADYDYSNLKKTGKTKTILGATCYEYVMSDDETKMVMWVAPDIQLPNWYIQNPELIQGHIMECTVDSKDGKMTSTVTAIHDNINRVIKSDEYKKMF